jgi:hypothetical protein
VSRPDPIGNEVRKVRRARRLGTAVCFLCGFADPVALVRANRTLLERHHPLAIAHAPAATVPLCRNCHALETERMRDAGIPLMKDNLSDLDVIEAVLRAQSVFLRDEADAWAGFAADLRRRIDDLDCRDPKWRDLRPGQTA